MEVYSFLFVCFQFFYLNFYSVVLVSTIQQCKSAVIIHTSPSSLASFPSPHPIPPGHHRAPDWARQRINIAISNLQSCLLTVVFITYTYVPRFLGNLCFNLHYAEVTCFIMSLHTQYVPYCACCSLCDHSSGELHTLISYVSLFICSDGCVFKVLLNCLFFTFDGFLFDLHFVIVQCAQDF